MSEDATKQEEQNTSEDTLLTNEDQASGDAPEADNQDATGTPESEGADDKEAEKDSTDDSDFSSLKIPEGLDTGESLNQYVELFKKHGVSVEAAQELVDLHGSQLGQIEDNAVGQFEKLKESWITEVKNDPEIGGDKLQESVATARLAIDKFGGEGLMKLLNDYHLGDNPEVIRFAHKIGLTLKEDTPGTGGAVVEKKSRSQILYSED